MTVAPQTACRRSQAVSNGRIKGVTILVTLFSHDNYSYGRRSHCTCRENRSSPCHGERRFASRQLFLAAESRRSRHAEVSGSRKSIHPSRHEAGGGFAIEAV